MNVTGYTEALARALMETASLGDERTQEVARSLVVALDPALRLTSLQMLSDAASQLDEEVDGVRVTVVMDGATPHLMVTELPRPVPVGGAPAQTPPTAGGASAAGAPAGTSTGTEPVEDDNDVRTTLRMPASLKARVDAAAQAQGRSVNAWLLDAVRAGLRPADPDWDADWDGSTWDTGAWRQGRTAGTWPGPGGRPAAGPTVRGAGAGLQGWFG